MQIKKTVAIVLIISLLGNYHSFAQQSNEPVAVLDLEANGITIPEAKTLTDKLRAELLNTGKFKVIERSQIEQVLKEQGFQQKGCTSTDCAVEIGQLLGVKNIITGSIGKVGETFLISLRIIDVSTSEITKIVDENMQCEIDWLLTKVMKNVAFKLAGLSNIEELNNAENKKYTESNKNEPKSSMGKFMVYIDPLGGLFFGPHIGCEIGVGANSFIDVHYRHSAFGLIYDAIATESFYYDMKMVSGAAGAGFKQYLIIGNMPHRLYLGGSFDFGWGGIKNVDEEYPNEDWETFANLLFFAGHAGWLWRFDGPFNLGLGLLFGVAIEVKNEKEFNANYPYEEKQPDKRVFPGGGLQLLLNFEFGK